MFESGIGSIGSGLFNLFGTDDPYQAAQGDYAKIPGMLQSEYNPWIQAGKSMLPGMQEYMNRGTQAGNELMNQYNQLTNNPSELVNKLGAGFHQSPGYAFQTQQALNAANRAAAAGGMAGSPEEQQQIASVTNQLANQDYYNYLNHSQQLYNAGLGGLQKTEGLGAMVGTDVYNQGANAANNLAQNLGEAYMNQGNLNFAQTQYNNERRGQAYGQIWGGMNDMFNPGGSMMGGSGFSGAYGAGGSPTQAPGQGGMQGQRGGSGGSGGSGMNTQELGELAGLAMMLF